MQDVLVLIEKLGSIIVIVCIGYFISYKKVLNSSSKDTISTILNRVALPLMIFASYAQIKLTSETISNARYVVIAALIMYALNYINAKFLINKFSLSPKERSVYINGAVHSNVAFLAFPLLFSLYGAEGLFYGTVYYMVDNIFLFTIGLKRLNHDSIKKAKLAPVTISLMISFPLMLISNYFKVDLADNFIFMAAFDIGSLTTPLAFLFIGMILYESHLKELIVNKPALTLLFIKMIIIPLFMILGLYLLNLDVKSLVLIVIVVQVIMPPYSSLLAMAYEYNQDVPMATSLVVLGHIFVIISVPILFILANILLK